MSIQLFPRLFAAPWTIHCLSALPTLLPFFHFQLLLTTFEPLSLKQISLSSPYYYRSMDFFRKPSPPAPVRIAVPTQDAKPLHPFYPLGVEVVNYLANEKDVIQLLAMFASICAVILGITWLGASKISPQLKKTDKLIVLWFTLCKSRESPPGGK